MFGARTPTGYVLAILIGVQKLPEGFNSYRELIAQRPINGGWLLLGFVFLSLLVPVATWLGITVLADHEIFLGMMMLFCAGGILYLTFQDIAPQSRLEKAWGPAFGAVVGFLIGVIAYMMLGS